jgi:ribonuclease VapC
MPAATRFAAALAVDTNGDDLASRRFDEAVRRLRIELIDFTPKHAEQAREARRMYGRKRHPAQLNSGDCMVHGVAKAARAPLLFKGNDFSQTDIEPTLKD